MSKLLKIVFFLCTFQNLYIPTTTWKKTLKLLPDYFNWTFNSSSEAQNIHYFATRGLIAEIVAGDATKQQQKKRVIQFNTGCFSGKATSLLASV